MVIEVPSIESLKGFITTEFQKIAMELKGLRQDYKSIDSCLNVIVGKLGQIDSFTTQLQIVVDTVKGKVGGLEGRTGKVERLIHNVDEDLENFN